MKKTSPKSRTARRSTRRGGRDQKKSPRTIRNSQASGIELHYKGRISAEELLVPFDSVLRCTSMQYGAPGNGSTNRLIHADNLLAMKSLLADPDVAGHVTLAYIDPPFASGNEFRAGDRRTATISRSSSDELAYVDRFEAAAYLEFVRRRLILLRELLGPRGSIWVHIGHQMSHYVRVLLDEVFGPQNFLNEIARVKCNPKNFARRAFGNIKDCLLYYSKNGGHVWNEQRELMCDEDLARLFPRVDSEGKRYATTPLHAPGETRSGPTGQRWKGLAPPPGRHWRYDPEELSRLDAAGLIEWSTNGNPRKKIFAEQVRRGGKKRQDVWTFKDPAFPNYPTEKNSELLRQIVLTSSDPDDLVLDCFAGSGTTLAAAASLGRRWIGIDASSVAIRRTTERLQSMADAMPFRVDELKIN